MITGKFNLMEQLLERKISEILIAQDFAGGKLQKVTSTKLDCWTMSPF